MRRLIKTVASVAVLCVVIGGLTIMMGGWLHRREKAQREERAGILTVQDSLAVQSLRQKYMSRGDIADEDFQTIIGLLKKGAVYNGPNNMSYAGHFGVVSAFFVDHKLTEAQKDKAVPLLKEAFHGPDTPQHLIKLFTLGCMCNIKRPDMIPEALICLEDNSVDVRTIAGVYLKKVGYEVKKA